MGGIDIYIYIYYIIHILVESMAISWMRKFVLNILQPVKVKTGLKT